MKKFEKLSASKFRKQQMEEQNAFMGGAAFGSNTATGGPTKYRTTPFKSDLDHIYDPDVMLERAV